MSTIKKTYLTSAVFIVISFCLIAIILILFTDIKKSSEEIPFQRQDLSSLQDKISSLAKFSNIYEEIKPNLDKINGLFIDPEVPVDFISFLEKTSQGCGISISTSLISGEENNKELWNFLSFQVTFNSSFSKFLTFLEKIENSPYLIKVERLNVRRLSDSDIKSKEFEGFSVGDVNTNLSIIVYTK